MRTWVTGAGGFMGSHLVDTLAANGEPLLATSFKPTTDMKGWKNKSLLEACDLRDRDRVRTLASSFRPERVFHLAAQSYPTASWTDPWYTVETNVIGTINLFEALREHTPDCRILNACSSAQYGFVSQKDVPVSEEHPQRPLHPYGVSKVAQEMLAYQYYKNFGVQSVSVRIFNTTGPRKVGDVCSDLTRRVVDIEKGRIPGHQLQVGTLTTRRALMDVRDCIRGFDLVIERGTCGEAYNIGGDHAHEVGEIVKILAMLTEVPFEVVQETALMRPTDEPIIWGSTAKLATATGWRQTIPLEDTLSDMLAYWRQVS